VRCSLRPKFPWRIKALRLLRILLWIHLNVVVKFVIHNHRRKGTIRMQLGVTGSGRTMRLADRISRCGRRQQ
jgi:hypothetical protein